MTRNFPPVDKKQSKAAKLAILKLLDEARQPGLAPGPKPQKITYYQCFFRPKLIKKEFPSGQFLERTTWHACVSKCLAQQISDIQIEDPFRIPNSEHIISFLQDQGHLIASGFSIDVEDMYYFIRHASLLHVLQTTIEEKGLTKFQNTAGMRA